MGRARQLRNAVVKLVGERCAIQKMQMEEMAGSKRNNDIENGVCYCEQSMLMIEGCRGSIDLDGICLETE